MGYASDARPPAVLTLLALVGLNALMGVNGAMLAQTFFRARERVARLLLLGVRDVIAVDGRGTASPASVRLGAWQSIA